MRRILQAGSLALAAVTAAHAQSGLTIQVCSASGQCLSGPITITITPGTVTPPANSPVVTVTTAGGIVTPPILPPNLLPNITAGTNGAMNGTVLYPGSPTLYTDVRTLSISPNNAPYQCYAGISATSGCSNYNFGFKFGWSGTEYESFPYGIPYNVFRNCPYITPSASMVNAGSPAISESDDIPFPDFGCAGPVEENGTDPRTNWTGAYGDHHWGGVDAGIAVETNSYQLLTVNGQLISASTAIWDLTKPFESQRALGRTSADAAGYPLIPFLVRPDEVLGTGTSTNPNGSGITHTMRLTLDKFSALYSAQGCLSGSATHTVQGNGSGTPVVCLGFTLRLQNAFVQTYSSPVCNILITGLKNHGAVYADVGNRNEISGVGDARYNDDDLLSCAAQLHGANFEVVNTDNNAPIFTADLNDGITTSVSVKSTARGVNVALPPPPSNLTLTPSLSTLPIGGSVTLTAAATNAGPGLPWTDCAGPIRGGSQTFTPTQSIYCTLYVQNAGGISRTSPMAITLTGAVVASVIPSATPGTYVGSQTVSLSSSTLFSTIHYTTDGSTPTCASPAYSAPFNLSSTTTIRAIACANADTPSTVATFAYTINPFVPVNAAIPTNTLAMRIRANDVSTATATTLPATSGTSISATANNALPVAIDNSLPVAEKTFDLSAGATVNLSSSIDYSNGYTMCMVYKLANTAPQQFETDAGAHSLDYSVGNQQFMYFAHGGNGSISHYSTVNLQAGTWYDGCIQYSQTTGAWAIWLNGVKTDSGTMAAGYLSAPITQLFSSNGSFLFTGKIAEAVTYSSMLSDSDMATLESAFHSMYGTH